MRIVATLVTSLSQLIFQQKKLPCSSMLRDGAVCAIDFKRFNLYKVRSIDLYHGFLGIEAIFAKKEPQVGKILTPFFYIFSFPEFFQSLLSHEFFLAKSKQLSKTLLFFRL